MGWGGGTVELQGGGAGDGRGGARKLGGEGGCGEWLHCARGLTAAGQRVAGPKTCCVLCWPTLQAPTPPHQCTTTHGHCHWRQACRQAGLLVATPWCATAPAINRACLLYPWTSSEGPPGCWAWHPLRCAACVRVRGRKLCWWTPPATWSRWTAPSSQRRCLAGTRCTRRAWARPPTRASGPTCGRGTRCVAPLNRRGCVVGVAVVVACESCVRK